MKKIRWTILTSLILGAFASDGHPASSRYGDWFIEEDWKSETCRMSKHIQERVFFFVEETWNEKFFIGMYQDSKFPENYKATGVAIFDNGFPILIKGEEFDNRLTFSSENPQILKENFLHRRSLRLTFDNSQLITPLNGSARAAEMLSVCAKIVWPGAGDE